MKSEKIWLLVSCKLLILTIVTACVVHSDYIMSVYVTHPTQSEQSVLVTSGIWTYCVEVKNNSEPIKNCEQARGRKNKKYIFCVNRTYQEHRQETFYSPINIISFQ